MGSSLSERLQTVLSVTFAIFVFGSTFSIALAQSALGISLILFLVLLIADRYNPFERRLSLLYAAILAYIGWLWIAAAMNENAADSIRATREEWLFLAIPLGVYLLSRARPRKLFLRALTAGVILVALYGLIQHFTGIILLKDQLAVKAPDFGYSVSGQFSHRLTFGNYFGMISVFLLCLAIGAKGLRRDRGRLMMLLASIMGIIVTLLSYSRGPIISLVGALLISGFVINRRIFIVGLPVLAVVVAALYSLQPGLFGDFEGRINQDLNDEYSGSRVYIWNRSAEIIEENPLFGVGPANFKKAYLAITPTDIPPVRQHAHAHNDLLNFAAISGLPGAVLWLALFLVVSIKLFQTGKAAVGSGFHDLMPRAALLATLFFLAASMTEAVFADEEVRQGLMFIWAAGLAIPPAGGTRSGSVGKNT
ncbi:MAG: O-antigen ligase family protein [bacterium]|nr:O-antigen ligase family protein [bacterium]